MYLHHLKNALSRIVVISAVLGLMVTIGVPSVEAQTAPQYISSTCTFTWSPNTEPDLAGYRAWAERQGSTGPALPIVTLTKTATSHPTSTRCADLGITADGTYRFSVLAFDLAGNLSAPTSIIATRDSTGPASPSGLHVTSPQPIALTVTPNPATRQATVAWIPGTCRREFIVTRLVSGAWVEVGRTPNAWLTVPLVNQVNQPYGVSAVCG